MSGERTHSNADTYGNIRTPIRLTRKGRIALAAAATVAAGGLAYAAHDSETPVRGCEVTLSPGETLWGVASRVSERIKAATGEDVYTGNIVAEAKQVNPDATDWRNTPAGTAIGIPEAYCSYVVSSPPGSK